MEYPKVLFHDSESTSFAWRDGYANIPTEILEALLEETRRATCSIEDELRQRGSVSATTSRVDNCLLRIRKDAEVIKICGRLDERSAGAASDLHSVMHTVQTDRNWKVYQQFLNDVLQHCGPECTLLCGVSLGRHKIANLRRDERASLLKHLKKECTVFSVEPITSLSKASRLGKFEANTGSFPPFLQKDQYFLFEFMRRHKVELLPEMFRSGMKTSNLWKNEENTGGLAVTNCLSMYLPQKSYEDAFFIARISYDWGFLIANMFGLGDDRNTEG